MLIIVPPKGMRYDLARQLVNNDAFAHMWLCHGGDGVCPDGCDTHGDPERVKLYEAIRVYHTERDITAYKRGHRDGQSFKSPLFRTTRDHGIRPTTDDYMSDLWDDDMRQAYIDGYASGMPKGQLKTA